MIWKLDFVISSTKTNSLMDRFIGQYMLYLVIYHSAQLGALCCIRELSKYLEVESRHLVTDYKQDYSMINWSFLCLILSNLC